MSMALTNPAIPESEEQSLAPVAPSSHVFSDRWLLVFVIAGFSFELGLWFLGDTALRLPLRIGMYVTSLAFVFLIRGNGFAHPAARIIQYILVVLVLSLLNPLGSTLPARFAQICLYFSVLGPLIWVGKLHIRRVTFQRLVLVMWVFYTASAIMGVLQVEYPGKFDGALSSNYDEQSLMPHVFILADGTKVIRPKGLTDVPGGASTGGVYSIILGAGILLTSRSTLLRLAAVAGMVAGLFCIFICQMRTNLIISGIAMISLLCVLLYRRSYTRAGLFMSIAAGVIFAGATAAFSIGGQSTVDRFLTLIASDPGTVFYQNRGGFLDEVFHNATHEYTLGAGLGRWGMMSHYFGNDNDSLWAEMMWQSLLYDGGVPLIALYLILIGVLLWTALKQALHQRDDDMGCWGGIVFGYTLAALAATFVFPIFSDLEGMEVLLLNASFFGACMAANVEWHIAEQDDDPEIEEEEEDDEDFQFHTDQPLPAKPAP
jgi:hypothetical protein